MALKALLDDIEDLDDTVKEHYKKDEKSGKYVLDIESVDSLPAVRKLKDETAKHRITAREANDKLKVFADLGDVDEVRQQLDRIPELEAAAEGKLDETKITAIVEGRIRTKLAPLERELATAKTQLNEKEQQLVAFQQKDKQRTIKEVVEGAARGAKVLPSAVEDVVLLAERHLELDEAGNVVTKDNAPGGAGLDVKAWLSDLQPKRPHWWPASGGGGGRPGEGGGGGENPWTAANWNKTKQALLYRDDKAKAERLAKAAGSAIGALNPPEKK